MNRASACISATTIGCIQTLFRLRDLGNSVIVVEHDEDTIRAADHVLDLGPGAGVRGGQLVAQGTLEEVMQVEQSLTAQYLSGRASIPVPKTRRKPQTHRDTHRREARAARLDQRARRFAKTTCAISTRTSRSAASRASPASPARANRRWSTTSCGARSSAISIARKTGRESTRASSGSIRSTRRSSSTRRRSAARRGRIP